MTLGGERRWRPCASALSTQLEDAERPGKPESFAPFIQLRIASNQEVVTKVAGLDGLDDLRRRAEHSLSAEADIDRLFRLCGGTAFEFEDRLYYGGEVRTLHVLDSGP